MNKFDTRTAPQRKTNQHSPKIYFLTLALIGALAQTASAVPLSVLDDKEYQAKLLVELPANSPVGEFVNVGDDGVSGALAAVSSVTDQYALCFRGVLQFFSSGGTEVWGWHNPVDDRDYAIMGIANGLVFVNAATLQPCDTVLGPAGGCGSVFWREMKTYGHYCYAVSECTGTNQGLAIMDIQYLPDSVHFVGNFVTSTFGTVTSHTIAIDTATGFAYLEGEGLADRSLHVVDLANPEAPVNVSSFGPATPIHDMYAHDDTVWVAEGNGHSFSIWDLANKLAPVMITRITIPGGGYVHNVWPTRNRQYAATTEEIPTGQTVKIWDVQNLGSISLIGTYIAQSGTTPHNAHFKDDTLYLSHYEAGIRVVSIANPAAPTTIGAYDTHPSGQGPGYNGCWGIWPYSPNGYVYASNLNGRLYIFQESKVTIVDSARADSIVTTDDAQIAMGVYAENSIELNRIILPISWAGSYNMVLDSLSVVGCRTSYFEQVNQTSLDESGRTASYNLIASSVGSSPDLAPGYGLIAKLHFTVPAGASGPINPVTFPPVSGNSLLFVTQCGFNTTPSMTIGAVEVVPCCLVPGDADHDGSVTVGDAINIISYIFLGGPAAFCPDEGDADNDGSISVGDAVYLIGYIFSGGAAPICFP